MTIPVSTRRNDYIGNGSVNTYAYGFKIFANTGLRVIVRNTDDVETSLVLTTDFTVTGAGDSGGGNIVLVSSGQAWLTGGNLTTGYVLTILGIEPLDQDTDIRNQGAFFPEAHEDAFDHVVMIIQQQQNELDGCVRLPDTIDPSDVDTQLPIPEASKGIRWNATADGFENYVPGSADDVIFPGGSGILVYDGSLNLIARTITGGTGITITNGSGVSGNPTVTLSDGSVTNAKMAYSSVNGQTAETAPATDDELLLGDTSAAALRKMTLANLLKVINALTADGSPDAAADYVATYDASAAAVKKVLLQNINTLRVKAGNFTRDMTAASGNVAYTGVGFTPKALIFFSAGGSNFDLLSWGFSTSGVGVSTTIYDTASQTSAVDNALALYDSGSTAQFLDLVSYDADGFTVTWTKAGSPGAGTGQIMYLAIG